MFAYCGNNPISRIDTSGNFWNIVVGAVVGAAFGAITEIASQVIKHEATGADIDWGAVAVSAIGGAVYGGTMVATGSNTAATVASTAATSIATGVKNGDSIEEIVVNTAKDTTLAAVTCMVPTVINKSLSGKYLKLNTVQKWIKTLTEGPYRGMYEKGSNYLPDVFSSGVEDFAKGVGATIIGLAFD